MTYLTYLRALAKELDLPWINTGLRATVAATNLLRAVADEGFEEKVARGLAESYGVDPDDNAPLTVMCTAENRPVAWWQVYEEQARALAELLAGMAMETPNAD